jgi:5-oxopent-3-ene-1,2,5-tricarboxylate decarboxylase/2-hydroxyhepta-2,4-diene-1,7-dioate isomerase
MNNEASVNYADHAKELAFKAPDEPLVFLKGPTPYRPQAHTAARRRATFMHYECELAVVIGRPARRVTKAPTPWRIVAGYTVANDYAVRDYLENWYRPNLRVKNRDGGTVLGPWLVIADEVPDPHALALRTRVNGAVTQQGTTART